MMIHPHNLPSTNDTEEPASDGGFSFVEVLVTMTILGILATIVAFGVGGIRAEAASSTCEADQRMLWTASEAYFNQNETTTILATGADHDAVERTLLEDGFLRRMSDVHDLDANGVTTPEANSPC